ncbi:hypothetical protein PROP_02176 [Propionicimonas sp. T2.31MG-18]|uniref:NADPH-dependent F420 reductase n=1 Tax=Propionicimonas sp. T2.31MG-18 TaxID=3157620 RepID=UPI0035E4D60B
MNPGVPTENRVGRSVGIIGAGRLGLVVARHALASGYQVRITASAAPGRPLERLGPRVTVTSPSSVAEGVEVVILAVPFHRFRELPLGCLAGHIVVDAMNHWPSVDETIIGFDSTTPTSVLVGRALPSDVLLVKALNHLSYHQLRDRARPPAAPDRIALAVSGDDPGAVARIEDLVTDLGFDPVAAGSLDSSDRQQPGSLLFGSILDASTMRHLLDIGAPPAGVGAGLPMSRRERRAGTPTACCESPLAAGNPNVRFRPVP